MDPDRDRKLATCDMEIRRFAFKILAKELNVMHASSISVSHGRRKKD